MSAMLEVGLTASRLRVVATFVLGALTVAVVPALAQRSAPPDLTQSIARRAVSEPIEIPLNLIGVFDTAFLNRRNPPKIDSDAVLLFDNRTSSRNIRVKFKASATAALDLEGYDGYLDPTCTMECDVIVSIAPRKPARVPVAAFRDDGKTISFSVTFVEETEEPAQPTGYFYVTDRKAPDDSVKWGVAASVGGALEPDTGGDDTRYSVTSPYQNGRDRHFFGTGELQFNKSLGDRVDAAVTMGFKDGDLGAADQTLKLQVNKYRVNVYAMNGVTLSFGKFTFASPTSALAIREKGEGYRLAWTHYAVSHIVRRESATGDADDGNRDDRELILEANNLSGKNWRFIRSANLIYVYGHQRLTTLATAEKPAVDGHSYMTGGGELFISPKLASFNATWALYGSRGRALDSSAFPKSSGVTTYGTASWTFFKKTMNTSVAALAGRQEKDKLDVNGTLTFSAGASTRRKADDDATVNHTYVGEHTLFQPDLLFISGFSGKLDSSAGVGASLSNKRYVGLSYNDERFSPLHLFAKHVLRVPDMTGDSDFASKSSTFTFHHYDIGRDAQGLRSSGNEANVLFEVETPANITTQLEFAYFWPRGSLRTVMGGHNPWSIAARVKVSL